MKNYIYIDRLCQAEIIASINLKIYFGCVWPYTL